MQVGPENGVCPYYKNVWPRVLKLQANFVSKLVIWLNTN